MQTWATTPSGPPPAAPTDTVLASPEAIAPEDETTVSALDEPRNGHRSVEQAEDRDHPDGPGAAEPAPVSAGTQVVQDAPAPTPAQLRVDFGAHLEANYRGWSPSSTRSRSIRPRRTRRCRTRTRGPGAPGPTVSRSPDPVGWVRRVAVRSTIRSWRRLRPAVEAPRRPGPTRRPGPCSRHCAGCPPPSGGRGAAPHGGAPVKEIAAVEGSRWAPPRPGSRGRRRS